MSGELKGISRSGIWKVQGWFWNFFWLGLRSIHLCDNEFYENGCWLIRRTSKRQGIMAVALETAVGGIRLGVQLNRRAENAQFPYSASSSLFFQARNLSSHSLVHDALCISSRARSAGEGAARLSIRSRAGSIAPPRSTLAESALPVWSV